MVLLTMTPSIVEAIQRRDGSAPVVKQAVEEQVSLEEPAVGKPISHGQVVELWKELTASEAPSHSLETLLRGARVYIPPPPPKPEPTPEYKALMARLRREEEERKYQRMVTKSTNASFASGAPTSRTTSSLAHSFAQVNQPTSKADEGDDENTMNEVHRQVMLVINFLVTILGSAATLWVLARWWSTPARLFLTLGGSIVVAIAEVGVYMGYVWHLGEARKNEGKIKEVREVVQTWVVEKDQDIQNIGAEERSSGTGVRLRKGPRRDET